MKEDQARDNGRVFRETFFSFIAKLPHNPTPPPVSHSFRVVTRQLPVPVMPSQRR